MFTREDIRDYLYCENYYYYKHQLKRQDKFMDESVNLNELLMEKLHIDNYGYHDLSKLCKCDAVIDVMLCMEGLNFKIDALVRNQERVNLYFTYNSTSFKKREKKIIDISVQLLTKLGVEVDQIYVVTLNPKYYNKGSISAKRLLDINNKITFGNNKYFLLRNIKQYPKVNISKLVEQMGKIVFNDQLTCKHKSRCLLHHECKTRQKQQTLEVNTSDEQFTFDKQQVARVLNQWDYPLIYLDFEWKTCPVPKYRNMKVNSFLPFQYSMHIEDADHRLTHKQFLGEGDCREAFIKQLLNDLPASGSIVSYNANGAEKYQLQRLMEQFPKFQKPLKEVESRIVDLAHIFNKRWVYHTNFQNSCSLKVVAKVLCGNDYNQLMISDGVTAVSKYLEYEASGYQDQDLKAELERYCGMDTFSEYLVVKFLRQQLEEDNNA